MKLPFAICVIIALDNAASSVRIAYLISWVILEQNVQSNQKDIATVVNCKLPNKIQYINMLNLCCLAL